MHINLSLPSGSVVKFQGNIRAHIGVGELEGRGPGIDIGLAEISPSVLWLIESALTSAGLPPASHAAPRLAGETISDSTMVGDSASSDSGMEDGNEWAEAEADLVRALWQELDSMSKLNPFQLLQVPHDSDDRQVRAAFGGLSKKYHPDRFARYESLEIRELASEVFILLRDAYRRISAESGREKERSRLGPAKRPAQVERSAPEKAQLQEKTIVDSQPMFQDPTDDAETIMRSEPRDLTKPIRTAPTKTDATLEGMQLIEDGEFEEARELLSVASRKDRNNKRARAGYELVEGLLALINGDRMEAGQRFEAALDFDPSNERAAREIADMRRFITSQRRGLLSKLMQGD